MYDISDEKRYELERGSQGYSEYSDLVDETQYEQEDIDNAINMFENLSDEEIKRIESGSDAFLDRLVNDYLVAEYGEILNKEQNKPEENKTTYIISSLQKSKLPNPRRTHQRSRSYHDMSPRRIFIILRRVSDSHFTL